MMPWWVFGSILFGIGAIILAVILWDELVDAMSGFKRRGHRTQHDVERIRRLHAQRARAVARARIPLQRGPKHRRE